MIISDNFDSGNIEVIEAQDFNNIKLNIRVDSNSHHYQWFHYRLQNAKDKACTMHILNAGGASFADAYKGYNACASYDRKTWFRVPTEYDGATLTIKHTPEYNSVYYAYFAPYSYEQHLDLVHTAQLSNRCKLESLGKTVQNRDIDFLTIGEPAEGKKKVWVIARQHPGESMASWFMEGFLFRLLDEEDSVARKLLDKAVFYVVPHINPDGSIIGNLRANAAGANLNREWDSPSLEKSPEVLHVRNKMDEIGVDLNLDVHGDEELPYNFVAGAEGNPGFTDRIDNLQTEFINNWIQTCPDFQDEYGYPKDKHGDAKMSICTNQIGQRFDCLALTIEMPFKDNADLPDPIYGWSADRSELLGASVLHPILYTLDMLR